MFIVGHLQNKNEWRINKNHKVITFWSISSITYIYKYAFIFYEIGANVYILYYILLSSLNKIYCGHFSLADIYTSILCFLMTEKYFIISNDYRMLHYNRCNDTNLFHYW